MLLAEEKKLSLTDPVAKYYPALTRAKDITLLDLGGHLSGYRDYYPLDFVDNEMQKAATADAIITEYATRPLDFEPRSRWSYSNTGFLILGRVIEKVSGQPFGAFISHATLHAAQSDANGVRAGAGGADMATGYTSFGLAPPIPADPEGKGWAGAAGAIWSTPTDLMTWDLALVEHKLISAESYATMTTARRLTDGRSSGYGCGEGVNDRGPAVTLSHGGAVSGFVAQNTVIPSTKSAVVLLSNTDFAAVGALNQELVASLMPHVDVPVIHGATALAAAQAFLVEPREGHRRSLDVHRGLQRLSDAGEGRRRQGGAQRARPDLEGARGGHVGTRRVGGRVDCVRRRARRARGRSCIARRTARSKSS